MDLKHLDTILVIDKNSTVPAAAAENDTEAPAEAPEPTEADQEAGDSE